MIRLLQHKLLHDGLSGRGDNRLAAVYPETLDRAILKNVQDKLKNLFLFVSSFLSFFLFFTSNNSRPMPVRVVHTI